MTQPVLWVGSEWLARFMAAGPDAWDAIPVAAATPDAPGWAPLYGAPADDPEQSAELTYARRIRNRLATSRHDTRAQCAAIAAEADAEIAALRALTKDLGDKLDAFEMERGKAELARHEREAFDTLPDDYEAPH